MDATCHIRDGSASGQRSCARGQPVYVEDVEAQREYIKPAGKRRYARKAGSNGNQIKKPTQCNYRNEKYRYPCDNLYRTSSINTLCAWRKAQELIRLPRAAVIPANISILCTATTLHPRLSSGFRTGSEGRISTAWLRYSAFPQIAIPHYLPQVHRDRRHHIHIRTQSQRQFMPW